MSDIGPAHQAEVVELSVVSPVYGAEECVEELCKRLVTVLDGLGLVYEIVLIDDRSPDGSWIKIQEVAEKNSRIRGFRLSRNFGQHYAMTAGISLARGERVVLIDCDLQESPEDIPRLVKASDEGHEIVLTRRQNRKGSSSARLGSVLFWKTLDFLTGERHDPTVGALSLLSRKAVDAFLSFDEYYRYYLGLIKYLGFDPYFVEVEHQPRHEGQSSYTLWKRLKLGIDGVISTSVRPLYLSVFVGFTFSLLAIIYLIYIVVGVLFFGKGVPGWPSAIAVSLLIGGVLASFLGVIGLYLGRIYIELRRRPLFVIADATDPKFWEQRTPAPGYGAGPRL